MEWFVVKYWTKYKVLNHSDMETYVNEIINERFNNWYKIKFILPGLDWLKHPENVVPLINTALCTCSFPCVHLLLENRQYSIDIIVSPILNKKIKNYNYG